MMRAEWSPPCDCGVICGACRTPPDGLHSCCRPAVCSRTGKYHVCACPVPHTKEATR